MVMVSLFFPVWTGEMYSGVDLGPWITCAHHFQLKAPLPSFTEGFTQLLELLVTVEF